MTLSELKKLLVQLKDRADARMEFRRSIDPDVGTNKVYAPTPDKITHLGIARTFQNIRLFSALSVLDNVLIAKHMRAKQNVFSATLRLNHKEERRMREEAMELLAEQGLDHLKDEVAGSLPYGIQRRLEIARALASDPRLIILDEPAGGMNDQETAALVETIRAIRDRGITVLLIEHDMSFVMGLCEHITVLDYGRIIAEGDPETVRSDPKVIAAYLGGEA